MAEDEGRIMLFLCNYIGKQASQVPVPVLALFSSFEPVSPQPLHFCSFYFDGLDDDDPEIRSCAVDILSTCDSNSPERGHEINISLTRSCMPLPAVGHRPSPFFRELPITFEQLQYARSRRFYLCTVA